MRYVISFARSRALGLPDASFSVSLQGMTTLLSPGAYLSGSGPPGGVAWFAVLPANGLGYAALEPALRSRLGQVVALRAAGGVPLAGAPRPGVVALAGEGHARTVALAVLIVDEARCRDGLVLVCGWSAGVDTQPTLAAILDVPELRALLMDFALGDDVPAAPQAAPVTVTDPHAWLEFDGPHGARRVPLGPARVMLGRGLDADVVIEDARVSRHHAYLDRRLEGYTLEVLSTANGVFWAGALRAQGRFPLADGDTFGVGDTRVRLSLVPGRAPRSPFQRLARLDAFFGALGLPSPPIPEAVHVVPVEGGLATPASSDPLFGGPGLSVAWTEGAGLAGFSFRWTSRAWSVVLEGASFGASKPDPRHIRATFRALGVVLADAMTYEGTLGPPGHVPRVDVLATTPAYARWTTPFGVEYLSDDAHDALLDALAWRRGSRL